MPPTNGTVEEEIRDDRYGSDDAFADDESWLDPVELLWGKGGFDAADAGFAESIESAADEIADELASLVGRGRPRFA